MEEFEKLQKLIRLKKYETPGEEFVDEFVSKFRERQRQELLKQSALALFWEQVKMYFSEAPAHKWALVAAAIAVLASAGWLIVPRDSVSPALADGGLPAAPVSVSLATDGAGKSVQGFSIEVIRVMGDVEIEPDPGLLSKHFTGGYDQIVIVPQDKSDSTIAVPYDFIHLDGPSDIH